MTTAKSSFASSTPIASSKNTCSNASGSVVPGEQKKSPDQMNDRGFSLLGRTMRASQALDSQKMSLRWRFGKFVRPPLHGLVASGGPPYTGISVQPVSRVPSALAKLCALDVRMHELMYDNGGF